VRWATLERATFLMEYVPGRGVVRYVSAKAIWNSEVVAESDRTIQVEGNLYFPFDDVVQEFLEQSDTSTHCWWKGDANYFSVVVNGARNEDAAWYYAAPLEAAADIRGYVAFWRGIQVTGPDPAGPQIQRPQR
jgi:uncharacterized protein (DUF427 family)